MSDDAECLLAYAREGSESSLSALIVRNSPWMSALLRAMLPDAEVEDALQDAWLKVIRSAHRFRGEGVRSYLASIARSVAIDRLRKGGKTVSLESAADDGGCVDGGLIDTQPMPSERFESSATRADVYRAVRSLADGPRQVLLLRVEGELSFREIAEELDVPLGTALTWMHKATVQLRQMLSEGVKDDGKRRDA